MPRERIAWIALAVLLVVGLIFAGVTSGQRNAWMEGYTMGRLTAAAGVDGVLAPMSPYMGPYATGFTPHGPGFGGFLFLLLGAGALFFFVKRMTLRAHWRSWAAMQGGPQGWPSAGAEGGAQPYPQAEWRHGPPPWMRSRWGCGPQPEQWQAASQPAAQASSQSNSQPTPDQPAAEQHL